MASPSAMRYACGEIQNSCAAKGVALSKARSGARMRKIEVMLGKVRVGAVLSRALAVWLTLACAAGAHELRPSIADAEVSATEVVLELEAAVEPMLAGIDQSAVLDTNDAPQADAHDAFRVLEAADLEAALRATWPELAAGFNVVSGGVVIALELGAIEVPEVGDVDSPRDTRLVLRGVLPEGDAPVTVGWSARYGALVLRQGDADTGYSGYLTNGDVSLPLPRDAVAELSLSAAFVSYIALGFEHIVPKGLDHILFVLGLFFFSLRWRPLLTQVTAFTVAHTVTLALATLGFVSLSPAIVEPLIALSIAYVAVENIISGGPDARIGWRRTAVVFAFGLLHGIGFASVLGEIGLSPGAFLSGLIGFNIGVELGQLAVITVAFLLLGMPFGRKPYYRKFVAIPGSVAIGAVGLWWAIERIVG